MANIDYLGKKHPCKSCQNGQRIFGAGEYLSTSKRQPRDALEDVSSSAQIPNTFNYPQRHTSFFDSLNDIQTWCA
jgi:hypothetical protein